MASCHPVAYLHVVLGHDNYGQDEFRATVTRFTPPGAHVHIPVMLYYRAWRNPLRKSYRLRCWTCDDFCVEGELDLLRVRMTQVHCSCLGTGFPPNIDGSCPGICGSKDPPVAADGRIMLHGRGVDSYEWLTSQSRALATVLG